MSKLLNCRNHLYILDIKFFFFKFFNVYFERERERENGQGGAETERETQNLKQAPDSELSAQSYQHRA